MKDLTIYSVYVEMESQEQCDRMKQICIYYNLPIWNFPTSFSFIIGKFFRCDSDGDFYILSTNKNMNHTKVTEQEFINLLKQIKQ